MTSEWKPGRRSLRPLKPPLEAWRAERAPMAYQPAEDGPGHRCAVDGRNMAGRNRCLGRDYRPQAAS